MQFQVFMFANKENHKFYSRKKEMILIMKTFLILTFLIPKNASLLSIFLLLMHFNYSFLRFYVNATILRVAKNLEENKKRKELIF